MKSVLTIRRARREDFARVRSLLGAHAPAARRERKRFRRLVSTLREDLYLAEGTDGAALQGLAVIAYTHGLGAPTAVVRRLLGASSEAATQLLDCACRQAAARGCAVIELRLDRRDGSLAGTFAGTLEGAGWSEGPETLMRSLPHDIGGSQ